MAKIKPSVPSKNLSKRKNALGKKDSRIKKQPGKGRGVRRGSQNKKKRESTGVVYLSHIPHGFYEEQIEAYFSQFGKVTAMSVPRSKSGRAKGYSFIEYKYPEIAKIAADTMNNYLMFSRLLKAKYIPPEQQKPRLFRIAKAARDNHKTAADKAALAVKHNRKLKNRHLKIGLEVKLAAKLLKKKKYLIKRAEKLGPSHDFAVEEGSVQSIFEQKKAMEAQKNSSCNQKDVKPEDGEGTDTSEEQSSLESASDFPSLESDDSLSGDDKEDVLSESEEEEEEEEDYKKIISKAKNAAKDILKKAPKATKHQKSNKGHVARRIPLKLLSPQEKETFKRSKNKPVNDTLLSLDVSLKNSKLKTPVNVKSPKGVVLNGIIDFSLENSKLKTPVNVKSRKAVVLNGKIDKNTTPKGPGNRKGLDKNTSMAEKTPSSIKKSKPPVQTPTRKKSKVSQVVMEVDDNDEEINLKTPPNVVKKIINTGKDSEKKISVSKQSVLTPKKQDSSKKTPTAGKKSPGGISFPSHKRSPSGEKLRHRRLKH